MEKVVINLLYTNGQKEKFVVEATLDEMKGVQNAIIACFRDGLNAYITLDVDGALSLINAKQLARFTHEVISTEETISDVYNDFKGEVSG